MTKIIDHNSYAYRIVWQNTPDFNKWNGAFYYSKEIVKNIIPRVKTTRNWITINVPEVGCDHAIVFVHNNLHPEVYEWLKRYNDLILVCGLESTIPKVAHLGKAIYLPLSIDTEYIQSFCVEEKTKNTAFAGRPEKRDKCCLPAGTVYLEGMPRTELLPEMAKYRNVYAVGRTAIEAKALGCNVLPYDSRFPDPSIWQVLDNREAAMMLQKELDKIEEGY